MRRKPSLYLRGWKKEAKSPRSKRTTARNFSQFILRKHGEKKGECIRPPKLREIRGPGLHFVGGYPSGSQTRTPVGQGRCIPGLIASAAHVGLHDAHRATLCRVRIFSGTGKSLSGRKRPSSGSFTEASKVFLELLEQCRLNNEDRWQPLVALAVTYDKSDQWVAALEYYEAFLRALTPIQKPIKRRDDTNSLSKPAMIFKPNYPENWVGLPWIANPRARRSGSTENGRESRAMQRHLRGYLPLESTPSPSCSVVPGRGKSRKRVEVALGKPTSWMASLRSKISRKKRIFNRSSLRKARPWCVPGLDLTGAGALAAGTGLFMTARGLNTIEDMEIYLSWARETSASRWKNLRTTATPTNHVMGPVRSGSGPGGRRIYFLFAEENLSGDSVDSGLSWQGTGASLTF